MNVASHRVNARNLFGEPDYARLRSPVAPCYNFGRPRPTHYFYDFFFFLSSPLAFFTAHTSWLSLVQFLLNLRFNMINFNELLKEASLYQTAVTLDNVFPKSVRVMLRYFFLMLAFSSFAASFVDFKSAAYNSLPDGLFFLFLSLFIIIFLLEAFYNSFKFQDGRVDFVLAQIILKTDDMDVTAGFLNSDATKNMLRRLGIEKTNAERSALLGSAFKITEPVNQSQINFADYARAIYLD
ncbi:MAG: hypothetical protein AAB863_03930, partial [Patescibacteria group bacterium]